MQTTVPSYAMRALVNFIKENHHDPLSVMSKLNIDSAELDDNKQVFSLATYESAFTVASQYMKVANVGFIFGQQFEISGWGILGYIAHCSPSLYDALVYQKKYQTLMAVGGHAFFDETPDSVTLRWLSDANSSTNSIEHTITSWVTFAKNMSKEPICPTSVHFTHECIGELKDYEDFFGCPIIFNGEFNGIVATSATLAAKLKVVNADVLNLLCSHADNLVSQKQQSASTDFIANYIIDVLPDHVPDLEEIAGFLQISTRQLQRKFEKENTNLTTLLESIRMRLATSYLVQTQYKLLFISRMLGYKDQSAFQRAFKRWTGKTPSEFRQDPCKALS